VASEVVTLHCKKCYVDISWYRPESFYCLPLLDHKVGGVDVITSTQVLCICCIVVTDCGK